MERNYSEPSGDEVSMQEERLLTQHELNMIILSHENRDPAEFHPVDKDIIVAQNAKTAAYYSKWIHDLQSDMYINCVYCGHRYGPNDEVPATMADVLKEHVEQCPEHPMSKLKKQLYKLVEQVKDDSQLHELQDLRKTAANLRFALQELYGLLSDGVDTSWFSTDEAQAARDILNTTMENDWDEE